MKQQTVLIVQNYNANKGDSSVIYAMTEGISSLKPDLRILLTSYDPIKAEREYGYKASEWLLSYSKIRLARTSTRKIGFIAREVFWFLYSFIYALFNRLGIRLLVPSFKSLTIKFYTDSDLVVLPGGHFFTSFNSLATNFSHFYALLFATLLGKRTMIYAQTIGPFFGPFSIITKIMTHIALRNASSVTVREESSLRHCVSCPNVSLTAESVFALLTKKETSANLTQLNTLDKRNRLMVGVTIHHRYYRYFFSRDRYVSIMSEIFDEIVERYAATILIVPMEDACHNSGDRKLAHEIRERAKVREHVYVLEGDHNALLTASVISRMNIFIGTKTHSVVHALRAGVPTISISYQQKSNEFMRMFGVSENSIDLNNLVVADFIRIFDRVHNRMEEIGRLQKRNLRSVRSKAIENNSILLSLLEE